MKRFYALVMLALVAVTPRLYAQSDLFSDEGYSRGYVSYSSIAIDWDDMEDVSSSMYPIKESVSLGYLKSGKLFNALPLHIEYGANIQYMFGEDSMSILGVNTNYTANTIALNVPLHASLNISLGKVAIIPYAGVNFRFNIMGKQTSETKLGNSNVVTEINLYDSSDSENAAGEAAWERFQTGFSYGVAVRLGRCTLSAGLLSDLTPIVNINEDSSSSMSLKTISLGYAF